MVLNKHTKYSRVLCSHFMYSQYYFVIFIIIIHVLEADWLLYQLWFQTFSINVLSQDIPVFMITI